MTLEVPRRAVDRGRKWPIAALVAVTVLIVAVGALWPEGSPGDVGHDDDPGVPEGAPADAAAPAASVEPVAPDLATAERSRPAAGEPVRRSRAWPVVVRPVCRDVEPARCQRVADAVLELLEPNGTGPATAAPRVVALTVWRSLICGDDLDCPANRLAGSTSLGSAVVRLAGSTGALWVNVVGESAAAGATTDDDGALTDDDGALTDDVVTVAWPVRWAP